MKRRRPTAASLDDKPAPLRRRACERSGCRYVGQPRLQVGGRHALRLIYLCSRCFESMPVDQLSDLFLRSARRPDRPVSGSRITRNNLNEHESNLLLNGTASK
jgi:hypothetical protein